MTRASTAPARLARAAALSVLVVALAAVGHAIGGGAAPQPGLLVALVAVSSPVTVLLCGRRVTRGVALAVLAVGQLALHGAFTVVGSCATSGPAAGAHAHHGGAHLQHVCATGAGSLTGSSAGAMVAWHVVATVVTALLVAGAERGFPLVAGVLTALFRAPAALVAPVLARLLPAGEPDARVATLHLRGAPARRGPPPPASPPTGTPRT